MLSLPHLLKHSSLVSDLNTRCITTFGLLLSLEQNIFGEVLGKDLTLG